MASVVGPHIQLDMSVRPVVTDMVGVAGITDVDETARAVAVVLLAVRARATGPPAG